MHILKQIAIPLTILQTILLTSCIAANNQLYDTPMNFQPVWSPDGEKILFSAKERNKSDLSLYEIGADGADLKKLTHHPGRNSNPVWSADGRQILFQSNRDQDGDKLYKMNSDGSNLEKSDIPEFKNLLGGDFAQSPDGRQIAFSAMGNIYTMDLQTRRPIKILQSVDQNETYGYSNPAWSPDGKQLAIKSDEATQEGLILLNSDGSSQIQISMNREAYGASWSPDSQQILYAAGRWVGDAKRGQYQDQTLWMAQTDGSAPQKLAVGADGVWSPTEQRIIFSCPVGQNPDQPEQWVICFINADGTDLVKLDQRGMSFAWSPDGQKIAFFWGTPDSYHLYVMNRDGSELKTLTD